MVPSSNWVAARLGLQIQPRSSLPSDVSHRQCQRKKLAYQRGIGTRSGTNVFVVKFLGEFS